MKTTGDVTDVQNGAILELLRKRVTVLGTFALSQLRVSSLHPIEPLLDTLRFQLETELLCQSRGKQQQTVQFWVPTSWWQHLKHTIGRRYFGCYALDGFNPQKRPLGCQGGRAWRWLGRRIHVKVKAVDKTVQWEVFDSYPKANVEVPADFGEHVRIVIAQGEVAPE